MVLMGSLNFQFLPQFAGSLDYRSVGYAHERAAKTAPNYDGQLWYELDNHALLVYDDGVWSNIGDHVHEQISSGDITPALSQLGADKIAISAITGLQAAIDDATSAAELAASVATERTTTQTELATSVATERTTTRTELATALSEYTANRALVASGLDESEVKVQMFAATPPALLAPDDGAIDSTQAVAATQVDAPANLLEVHFSTSQRLGNAVLFVPTDTVQTVSSAQTWDRTLGFYNKKHISVCTTSGDFVALVEGVHYSFTTDDDFDMIDFRPSRSLMVGARVRIGLTATVSPVMPLIS